MNNSVLIGNLIGTYSSEMRKYKCEVHLQSLLYLLTFSNEAGTDLPPLESLHRKTFGLLVPDILEADRRQYSANQADNLCRQTFMH